MRLYIAAIGRMKKGPEQELALRYADRTRKSGKAIGITTLDILELPESRAADAQSRKAEEGEALLARLPQECTLFAFDERGKCPSSRDFATHLSTALDGGQQNCAFVIGGPDGLSEALRARAAHIISFGALTIPHQIVRILVLEQVYRATTILTNHPYHRD